ncbi:hypothetical protein SNEBB_009165, partial [Seison nebaliae]
MKFTHLLVSAMLMLWTIVSGTTGLWIMIKYGLENLDNIKNRNDQVELKKYSVVLFGINVLLLGTTMLLIIANSRSSKILILLGVYLEYFFWIICILLIS